MLALRLLGQVVTLVLVLEVADVPLICSDEWPVSFSGSASETIAATSQSALQLAPEGVARSGSISADCCACPCHLNYRSARGSDLIVTVDFVPISPPPRVAGISTPAAPLDHPPQNLL